MLEKFTKILSAVFAVFWFVIIFTEYWRNNPDYAASFRYFSFLDLTLVFLLIGAAASWGISRIKKKPIRFVNGLSVFFGLLILDSITMIFFYGKIPSIVLSGTGLFYHLGHLVGVAAAIFLVYLTARVAGKMLTKIFPLKIAGEDLPVIQTALGISLLTFLLFIFGSFGLLKSWIVVLFFPLILLADLRSTIRVIKKALFQPLKITGKINAAGIFSFLFLGLFLVFDFTQILRPFPAGTDSINLYVNLPKLIGESGQLVAGHQPYNWSLFMAFGTVVFGRIDVTLALSFLGGFLALRALYRLSRKWLTVNQSALCLLLFGSLPMTNFFLYRDMKIDLGLLFLALCVLLLLYNQILPPKKHLRDVSDKKTKNLKNKNRGKSKTSKPKFYLKEAGWLLAAKGFFAARIPKVFKENHLFVIMGFLSGFAFGVKLTILFFFFALVAAVWYSKSGIIGFFAALFLILGTVFLLKIDAQPQLRGFHDNVFLLQWVCLAIGLGLTGYLFFNRRKATIDIFRKSMILALFFILPNVPWFSKNLAETGKFSIGALLNGKKATPEMSLKELENLIKK